MQQLAVKTRADSPELRKAAMAVEQSAWNALGFLNFTRAHYQYYEGILDHHADCQVCLVDEESGYPVAVGTCAPFYWDGDTLPQEGWDWIVERASKTDKAPNMLGGLGISVPRVHRSKGFARKVIRAMRDIAVQRGYKGVVIPVRPTSKSQHPLTPMADYMTWQDEQGRAYDPWLRSHLAAGGKIVGECARSMVVEEPVAFWETWTGEHYETSGAYAFKGGLAPVDIARDRDIGRYEEPNVWFSYSC